MQSLSVHACIYVETDKIILKFIRNCKGSRKAQTILKKKDKVGELALNWFQNLQSHNN